MAYKFKPNKAVAKRMRMTRTGKMKHEHCFHTHLMSARPAGKRRKIRRPSILFEGHARNMRKLMGIAGIHPNKIKHERELAAKAKAESAQAEPATSERK